ncbi:MAG: hypothetical protein AAF725_19230 [Acidobacteriota bacterium]
MAEGIESHPEVDLKTLGGAEPASSENLDVESEAPASYERVRAQCTGCRQRRARRSSALERHVESGGAQF